MVKDREGKLSVLFVSIQHIDFTAEAQWRRGNAEKKMTAAELNELSGKIVASAIEVHRAMGPGLLENVYEDCMIAELTSRGIKTRTQVHVPLVYKNEKLESRYQIDILVENEIILELKAVTEHHPIFEAQIISYLKLADKRLGLLLNFHVPLMKSGIKRFVNGI